MTKQRKLIKDIIENCSEHLTAEEVYDRAKAIMPSVARGTVYRNLNILSESGEVRKLEIPDSPSRYDRAHVYHEHLICSHCGAVEDLFLDGVKEFIGSKVSGITAYNLTMYHICDKCRNMEIKEEK